MGTKQIQMEFQVVANDGISANVIINVNDVEIFSGALAKTLDVMPGQVYDDLQPFRQVNFDLIVPDQVMPPGSAQPWGQWTTPFDVSITVSGGSVTLHATESNYVLTTEEVSPPTTPPQYQLVRGNAEVFAQCHFNNQPVWTPPATGRLVYEDNIDTGPGSLLVLDNETVVYQVAIPYFSA